MLGDNLMALWFKPEDGYVVPEAKGRYIDMGMAFKRGEAESKKHTVTPNRPKRKAGELLELVYSKVTTKWQNTVDISGEIDAARESVRSCLEKLTKLGRIQSFGTYKQKQYRRIK